MSQADKPNTTNPSRRALLTGAPAAATVALVARTAVNAVATADAAEVDPVFAVIDDYRAAVQARSVVLDNEPGETTLGLACGSGGGHRAAAANDLMLRLAETLLACSGSNCERNRTPCAWPR
jgi:hypothetical protein